MLPFRVFERLGDIPFNAYRRAGVSRLLIRSDPKGRRDVEKNEWSVLPREHFQLNEETQALLSAFAKASRKGVRWIVHSLGKAETDAWTGRIVFENNQAHVAIAPAQLPESAPKWAKRSNWRAVHKDDVLSWRREVKEGVTAHPLRPEVEVPVPLSRRILHLADEFSRELPPGFKAEASFSTTRVNPHTPLFYDYLITEKPARKP